MIRLTDNPDMTIAIYRGHKTTMQLQGRYIKAMASTRMETFSCPDSLFSTKIMRDWEVCDVGHLGRDSTDGSHYYK